MKLFFPRSTLSLGSVALAFTMMACSGAASNVGTTNDDLSSNTDIADHDCRVVLRTASLPLGADADSISADGQWFLLEADVDVATSILEPTVKLEWITQDGHRFTTTDADDRPTLITGAPSGFNRFHFRITHDTIPATGIDETVLASSRLSILPLLEYKGDTFYDHNRVTGAFDTYTLWSGDTAGGLVQAPANNPSIGASFAVKNDPDVCK